MIDERAPSYRVPASDLRASLLVALDDLSAAEEAHKQAASDAEAAEGVETAAAQELHRRKIAAKEALIMYGVESAL